MLADITKRELAPYLLTARWAANQFLAPRPFVEEVELSLRSILIDAKKATLDAVHPEFVQEAVAVFRWIGDDRMRARWLLQNALAVAMRSAEQGQLSTEQIEASIGAALTRPEFRANRSAVPFTSVRGRREIGRRVWQEVAPLLRSVGNARALVHLGDVGVRLDALAKLAQRSQNLKRARTQALEIRVFGHVLGR